MFSQSLCFGENTLQEIEKQAGLLQPVNVSTPNRSASAINSDSDIIEESPTNHTSYFSYRERKLNKSKASNKKRKGKSRSAEQLTASRDTYSEFFRSDYEFNDEISKLLPGNTITNTKTHNNICDKVTAEEKVSEGVQKLENIHCYESDMFSDFVVPQSVSSSQPSTEMKTENNLNNSDRMIWGDSYVFNELDMNFGNDIQDESKKQLIQGDEQMGLGIDTITFTQINEDMFDDDFNLNDEAIDNATSKLIEEEVESFKNSFMDVTTEVEECQMSTLNVNNSGSSLTSSFTLNYSDSSMDTEEKPPTDSQSLKHDNSIDKWGLPLSIVREYHRKGIYNMFDWQRECLSNQKVLFGSSNLVYCAPTSAGKTLVSEILMIKSVLEKRKKVLIILPFISVVREKMNYLQDLLTSTGIQVEGHFGGYSPRSFDTVDVAVCTIEKANSIVNKLLEQKQIDSIGCIVVDEVHLISDTGRGYIMELLLAKILYVNDKSQSNIQLIAMSATLPNLDLLTGWLRAEFYHTDFRPVELKEMIKINNQIFDNKMNLLRTVSNEDYQILGKDPDNIAQMCVETILEGGSVIVFCPSKEWCEKLAKLLSDCIYRLIQSENNIGVRLREQIKTSLIEDTKTRLKNCPAGLDRELAQTLSRGCAYHHSGLTTDERDIVENSFKVGSIRIIVSTSTLSSGVNLPARRVIIRSPSVRSKMMDPLMYKQMIGRAGRTGKDTIGESILICDNSNRKIGENLIVAKLKPLMSCLGMNNYIHLIRAILEINAAGVATTKEDLEEFCQCTLLASEMKVQYKCDLLERDLIRNETPSQEKDSNSNPIGICMRYLLTKEFIRLQMNDSTKENNFIATRLGSACLASNLPPKDGLILRAELQKSSESFVVETDLHAIYLVTPLSICYELHNLDWMYFLGLWEKLPAPMRRVGKLVGVREAFLVKAVKGQPLDPNALQIHKRFYTALALEELVSEKNINDVAHKYKFPRGQLQALQQQASIFAALVTSFCTALNWTMLAKIIAEFKERLFFGVHHDLIDLMKIPNLNSRRARALFDQGIKTLSDLANSDPFTVEKILYNSISFDTKQRDGENQWEAEKRNKLRCLFVTGKSGLTVREAADEMIQTAQQYVELEMGVKNIVWSNGLKQSQGHHSSDNEITSNGITGKRIKIEVQSPNSPSVQINRKRRLDDSSDFSRVRTDQRFGKKFRLEQSESESESDSDGDSVTDGLTCVQIDSAESNAIEEADQTEFIEKLIKHESIDDSINLINVFKKLEFFKEFEATVKKSSVISVSIGVNQLTQRAPIIGLNSMVKQMRKEDEDIGSYNCTFDDDKFIAVISLCLGATEVFYLNMQNETGDDVAITFNMKIKFLVDLFHMKQMTVVMYDAKEQCKVLLKAIPQLRTLGVQLRDPLVANWLLDPDVYGNLFTMVRQYSPRCSGIEDIAGVDYRNRGSISLNCKTTVSPTMRSSVESFATLHIMDTQMDLLHRTNSKMAAAFADIEMPIQSVLLTMELNGFPADLRKINDISSELMDTLKNLECSMYRSYGRSFNVKSKTEKAKVLGLKPKNGKISTSKAVLEKLSHPVAKLLLQHKTVHSTLKTIIQPFIRQTVNNRIYPRSSCFSSTGRVHLYDPSLQNVANDFEVSTDNGSKTISCRRVFQPCPENELISADFCQLELRILSHFSNDQSLTKIMRSHSDVFKVIAAKWNNVSEAEVTDKQRNDSKQMCYGIIYGMGVRALAEKMNCDETEAQQQQDLFLKCYPGLRNFTDRVIARARQSNFIETIAGRRRYLPNITSTDPSKRAKAERQAVNSTIQGSAADIAKLAMLEMDKCLRQRGSTWKNVHLVLHVHDELVYEAPKAIVKDVVRKLKSSMENCYQLNVPLRVKVKVGSDWGTMVGVE